MALWRERERVAFLVAPTTDELAWRAIHWQTAIGQARRLAAQTHAPILAWVGWGTPLGACDGETLDMRRRILRDPRIQALISMHCVPLALDGWRLVRRADADGQRLHAVVHALDPHSGTGVGLYLLDGQLAPIAMFHVEWSEDEVASRLDAALKAAHAPAQPAPMPWSAGSGADAAPAPPAGALLLTVASRQLQRHDGALTADGTAPGGGLDRCWLAPAEWRALIPDGPAATLPAAITVKLARQLVDHSRDERGPWPATSVRAGSITACRVHQGVVAQVVELRGHLSLADDDRRCEADLAGTLNLEGAPGAERIVDLHLVLLLHAGDAPGRPVGLALGLDPGADAAAVPPCGMRDLDYFDSP